MLCVSFWTVAVKPCVFVTWTEALEGEMLTEMGAAVMFMLTEEVLVLSAMEVAVSTTEGGLGTLAGAV